MPNILLGCEQALETSFCFLVIAIHIHENLRGTAIIGDDDRSYGRKSDSRVRQFAFHQGFDFLAQGFAQSSAMIFKSALFHHPPQGKTDENIRKTAVRLGLEVLLSRTFVHFRQYRGNTPSGEKSPTLRNIQH